MPSLQRRRLSLFVLFFCPGLGMAAWVTRTPDVRDLIGASTAEMGLVLLGLSAGSMLGVLAASPVIGRFGTRPGIVIGASNVVVSLPVIGLGTALGLAPIVALGLFLFGAGMGSAEIAMNVEGAAVEEDSGKPLLPALHGAYSVGTVIGALTGVAATLAAVPVLWHLLAVAICVLPLAAWALRGVPVRDRTPAESAAPDAPRRPVWKDRRLVLIGVIILALALAEGSATDWLPLLMVDGHGLPATTSSLLFAAFAAAMAIGRIGGGALIERFGRAIVLGSSAALGAVGLALVVFADNVVVAGLAVVLWGIGASLGFPVAISAAGDSGPDSARRVSFVATLGYIAFLVGPPLLGFIGEHSGLRAAMIVVLVGIAVAVVLSPVLRPTNAVSASVDEAAAGGA